MGSGLEIDAKKVLDQSKGFQILDFNFSQMDI